MAESPHRTAGPESGSGPGKLPAPWGLVPVVVLAAVWRVAASRVASLGSEGDEILMAYGLVRSQLSGEWRTLLVETPVMIGTNCAPLWWWLQALPFGLLGFGKLGLRLLPGLIGVVSAALAYRAGQAIGGPRGAWLSGLVVAVGSPFVYKNCRGEWTETLIVAALLVELLALLPRREPRAVPVWSAAGPALAMLSHLTKGIVVWQGYLLHLGALWLLGKTGRAPAGRLGTRRLLLLGLVPALPSLAWLVAADRLVFAGGRVLGSDLGVVGSAWDNPRRLLLEFDRVKPFLQGPLGDALYVYTDFRAWPALAVLAVPLAAALLRAAVQVARGPVNQGWRGREMGLVPLTLGGPALAWLLLKGLQGVRFHLLFLPILIPFAAALLVRWVDLGQRGRWGGLLAGGALGGLYLSWTACRTQELVGAIPGASAVRVESVPDWTRFLLLGAPGLLALGLLGITFRLSRSPRRIGIVTVGLLSAVLVLGEWRLGVVRWGRSILEPMAWNFAIPKRESWGSVWLTKAGAAPEGTESRADLLLLRTYLRRELANEALAIRRDAPRGSLGEEQVKAAQRRVAARARPLLEGSLERHGREGDVVALLGTILWDSLETSRARVLHLWESYPPGAPGAAEVHALARRARVAPADRDLEATSLWPGVERGERPSPARVE